MKINKLTIVKTGMCLATIMTAGAIALGVSACGSSENSNKKNTAEIIKGANEYKNILENQDSTRGTKQLPIIIQNNHTEAKTESTFNLFIISELMTLAVKQAPTGPNVQLTSEHIVPFYTVGDLQNPNPIYIGLKVLKLPNFVKSKTNEILSFNSDVTLQYAKINETKHTVINKYTPISIGKNLKFYYKMTN